MKKNESLLWQRIKKLKLKGQLFRIESNTINGIPDVYWHLEHYQNKGTSFILREVLSQRAPQNLQLWLVREPRTLVRAYSSLSLKEIFKKIQDA